MIRRFIAFALVMGLTLSAQAAERSKKEDHLALGDPSSGKAKEDGSDANNLLMKKELFTISYNASLGTPNWVAWRLVKEDYGDTPRDDEFHVDGDLKAPIVPIRPSDYDNAGFDRGHMCPNGDRDVDDKNAKATFTMTNMVPQSAVLNRQSWKLLEEKCRVLADKNKELYIIAGPLGKGGHGEIEKRKKGKIVERIPVFTSLIKGKVTVPDRCWKVIIILDPEKEPGKEKVLERVNEKTKLIAVVMANDMTPKKWEDHRVSVVEIENLTGLTFFKNLNENLRQTLIMRGAPPQVRGFGGPAHQLVEALQFMPARFRF